jgi:transposase-like protein
MKPPTTLQEAIVYFSDYDRCREFMTEIRWSDGTVRCPQCDSDHVVYLEKARVWKCYSKHQKAKFSLKTGTIFEDSPLGLDKWLVALWLIVNCKNGISSCEIARDLGITQKSAWFMAHRLRLALNRGSFGTKKFSGEVEVDETFIGGRARNMHAAQRKRRITGTGTKDKLAVLGILERDGQVRTMVLENRRKRSIQPHINGHVEAGAALYSDSLLSYDGLEGRYAHQVIDHAVEYVNGQVHTNGLENYWSLLKRGIAGTYVSVEPFHLFRYLDEQAFRFNYRKHYTDYTRFKLALWGIVGKRLTWKEVIGMQESASWKN